MKKQSFISTLFFFGIILAFSSCNKGELSESQYYGSFNITGSGLSTSDMVVKYNGDSVGVLKADAATLLCKIYNVNFQFPEGKGVVALYKEGKLVDDTTITVIKDSITPSLEAIYSDRINVYGFWNASKISDYVKISADSVKMEIRYLRNDTGDASLNDIEITFGYYDSRKTMNYTQRSNSPDVNLTLGASTKPMTFGFNDNSGNALTYTSFAIQVRNKSTGALLNGTKRNSFSFMSSPKKGKYYIASLAINGNATTGYNVYCTAGSDPIN
jgi:hypothetical protein